VTKAARTTYDATNGAAIYTLTLGTMIGGALEDKGSLQFYDLTTTGTVDLSAGDQSNYSTCTTCVLVFEDIDPMAGATKTYYQKSGTVTLGATTPPAITGSITDLTLIEVTIDSTDYTSTPVDGGGCYHLATGAFAFDVAPATWTCDEGQYADHAACDCADCGVVDPDCADSSNTIAGCETGQTCPTAKKCEGVPTAWTCPAAKYNGGAGNGCDCGCGAPDPDCDLMGEVVAGCMAGETCAAGACIPAGWTCDPTYYGDMICDCGCGVKDVDCADLLVATCEFCDDMGSCNTATCPGTINPTNNAACQ
jgi:hypothetical protein